MNVRVRIGGYMTQEDLFSWSAAYPVDSTIRGKADDYSLFLVLL